MSVFEHSEESRRVLRDLQLQAEAAENPYDSTIKTVSKESLAGWSPPVLMTNEERKKYDEYVIRLFDEAKKIVPTEYEDPNVYQILHRLLTRVVIVAKNLQLQLPTHIPFGSIKSLKLNTHVIPIGDGNDETLLVFNRSLIPFCYQLSSVFALCLNPKISDGTLIIDLDDREPTDNEVIYIHDTLADAIRRVEYHYDDEGNLHTVLMDRLAPRRHLDVDYPATLVREILLESMEGFVIGHELFHASLYKSVTPAQRAKSIAELGEMYDRYSDEHICDVYGQMLSFFATRTLFPAVSREVLFPLCISGGLLFLEGLRLAQRAAHLVRTHDDLPDKVLDLSTNPPDYWKAHPPTSTRIHYLQRKMEEWVATDSAMNNVDMFAVYKWTSCLLEKIWSILKPQFRRYFLSANSYSTK